MDCDFARGIRWVVFGLLVILSATLVFGQGIVTGSMSGTAVDPQKAVVTGAKVVARHVATGQDFKTTTNEVGFFSLRSIPIGIYRVTVESPNFRKLQVDGIEVTTGTNTDLGALALAVGTTAETVTVEAATPLIETTSVQGGSTFDFKKVADLPISNAFDDLAFYTPGVSTVGSQGFSNTNGEAFAVNGQRGRNNNFEIDGQANNDNSIGGPSLFMGNQDVIAEFRIITNNADVSYGRNSGATVNYVTKSGTNNFHGTGFEYYTGNFGQSIDNSQKNAALGFCLKGQNPGPNDSVCTPVSGPPRYDENRWGGTLGGPIIPNKAWFFGSYMEDLSRSSGAVVNSSTITPTPAGMAMLNATFPTNTAVKFMNAFGPYAYSAGNPHPVNPSSLVMRTVSDGITTLDGVPFQDVARGASSPANDWETGGRVDWQITPKDLFFTRYYYQKIVDAVAAGVVPSGQWVDVNAGGQQIALDWTRTFTNHFVNQVRFNYERLNVVFDGGSNPGCKALSINTCPTNVAFGDSVSHGGGTTLTMGLATNFPQGRLINNSQWQDNASLVKGRHTFKFGGEYARQRSPNVFLPNTNGAYTFPGTLAGCVSSTTVSCAFDAFMQNTLGTTGTLGLVNGPPTINYKEQDSSLYISDEWRFRDNLTLTLGMRWEYWQQAFNNLANLSIATQTGPNPFWNTALPLSRTTLPKIPNDTNNFGPSLGFAWTPHMFRSILGDNKTVIRGGYRISYDPTYYNLFLNTSTSAPVVNAGTIHGVGCTAPCFPLTGFTGVQVQANQLKNIPTGVDPGTRVQTSVTPNFHSPYVNTWTLGIQHEFTSKIAAEARYVGSHTVGEFQTLNGNPSLLGLNAFNADAAAVYGAGVVPSPIPPGVTACPSASTGGIPNPGFAAEQINCNFTNVSLRANTAWSTYNALQTELKIRQWHGVNAGATFTWSKEMDNASEAFNTGFGGQTIAQAQDPFNTNFGERGLSGLDFPRVLAIYMLYETPWYKNQQGLLGHILGGWQFNTTYRFTSGELWTPRSANVAAFGIGSDYCDVTYATTLPSSFQRCRSFLGNPSAPVDTIGQCTDPTLPGCGLVDFFSGAPTTAAAVHWIYNDDNAALFFKTPYGMRRNPGVRGDHVNTVNFSLFKNTRLSEHVNMRLEGQVYNLFNTTYLGVPGTFMEQGNLAFGGPFGTTAFNSDGGQDFGSTIATGLGVRTVSVGAKIIF